MIDDKIAEMCYHSLVSSLGVAPHSSLVHVPPNRLEPTRDGVHVRFDWGRPQAPARYRITCRLAHWPGADDTPHQTS